MIVGSFANGALEHSYVNAFKQVGHEVYSFDLVAAERRNCRFGQLGRAFNRFVPVWPWVRKANREMLLEAVKFRPDLFVVAGQNRVMAGALAQLRAMTKAKFINIWPDSLIFFTTDIVAMLPLYDYVGTYSKSTVPMFERLGVKAGWVPVGADPDTHAPVPPRSDFACEVSFIGQWRPERDQAIAAILAARPSTKVKIWGPDWGRRTANPAIRQAWQKRSLYGVEFAQAVASSVLCLNIIDDTNYPAANMRFFEIPCAGGLQVSSSCLDMEDEFKDGETVLYYRDLEHLSQVVRAALADPEKCRRIKSAARAKVLAGHTYVSRVEQLLAAVQSTPDGI